MGMKPRQTAPAGERTFVALLRGINVGGKNIMRMAELRACFEAAGYGDVTTYIQSGNVVFTTSGAVVDSLAQRIERMLSAAFDYDARVVLRSRRQMQAVVARAPQGFGARPAEFRYDVIFLKSPLTAAAAIDHVDPKPGVDEAHKGDGVLYFSRLISRASQSRLSRIVSLPIYQSMTIRNWNTTTKLLRLMDPASVQTPR